MLHSAILPHHTKWFQLFEQLRYIVIDETHSYRGIFGSHVANVLRRLLRLCDHYGSKPQIICCSATIGQPRGARRDADRPADDGHRPQRRAGRREARRRPQPAGHRRAPGHPAGPARHCRSERALAFLRAGRQTIVFAKARVAVELLLTSLREALREGRGPLKRIRGYRSGYLPTERRDDRGRACASGEVLGRRQHERA